MLDDLEYDDSESPAIGLVPDGVSWEEVQNHIKIAHNPLLVPRGDSDEYVGAYWADTRLVVAEDHRAEGGIRSGPGGPRIP